MQAVTDATDATCTFFSAMEMKIELLSFKYNEHSHLCMMLDIMVRVKEIYEEI